LDLDGTPTSYVVPK
jgi:hypothetical protein